MRGFSLAVWLLSDLLLFLVDGVLLCDRVEFLHRELGSCEGLAVLERIVGMTFADAFCVAF